MIIGIGIDLVDSKRIERLYLKYGDKFLNKFLSPLEEHNLPSQPIPYLAARFAAKEACSKALGTGFAQGVEPKDIEVVKNDDGSPRLILHGQALVIAREKGVIKQHVSLSHERNNAIALVIMEGE